MAFLGCLAVAMFVGASCGCFSRTWTTYTIYGCSPRLFFSTFNGLHQLLVIIPNFVRGGYNTVTSRMEGSMDITPLIQQINELREMVYGSMRPGDVPPPYPHPIAPPMGHLFTDVAPPMDTLFTDELFKEAPEPLVVQQVYPDLKVKSKFKVFKNSCREKAQGTLRLQSTPTSMLMGPSPRTRQGSRRPPSCRSIPLTSSAASNMHLPKIITLHRYTVQGCQPNQRHHSLHQGLLQRCNQAAQPGHQQLPLGPNRNTRQTTCQWRS